MSYPEKFKQGFINQIEKELNKCEIIYNPNTKGIWFVNREEKYWYLEYKVDTNYLWWRYDFFKSYTDLLSMPSEVFEKVISEWVENKLNGKVATTKSLNFPNGLAVEDTLNCKVVTTHLYQYNFHLLVEDTLNCKVDSTTSKRLILKGMVEDTLNCKVLSTILAYQRDVTKVEETLNCKVLSTEDIDLALPLNVEDTLNCKVESVDFGLMQHLNVEETLNYKVDKTFEAFQSDEILTEETLNCKVDSTWSLLDDREDVVEDTLICNKEKLPLKVVETLDIKIKGTILAIPPKFEDVQETLNLK